MTCDHDAQIRDLLEEREELLAEIRRLRMGNHPAGRAALEAERDALADAVDRVRRRHPRGDEESGLLAPGKWCPTCGHERSDNGYGGCPDRRALIIPGQPLRNPADRDAAHVNNADPSPPPYHDVPSALQEALAERDAGHEGEEGA